MKLRIASIGEKTVRLEETVSTADLRGSRRIFIKSAYITGMDVAVNDILEFPDDHSIVVWQETENKEGEALTLYTVGV